MGWIAGKAGPKVSNCVVNTGDMRRGKSQPVRGFPETKNPEDDLSSRVSTGYFGLPGHGGRVVNPKVDVHWRSRGYRARLAIRPLFTSGVDSKYTREQFSIVDAIAVHGAALELHDANRFSQRELLR